MNGHTIGFHPQTQKLNYIVPCDSTAELILMANGSEKVVQMLRDRWQQYLQVVYIIFCLYDARKSKSPPGYKAPPQSDSQETTRVCRPAEMILFGRSVDLIIFIVSAIFTCTSGLINHVTSHLSHQPLNACKDGGCCE